MPDEFENVTDDGIVKMRDQRIAHFSEPVNLCAGKRIVFRFIAWRQDQKIQRRYGYVCSLRLMISSFSSSSSNPAGSYRFPIRGGSGSDW